MIPAMIEAAFESDEALELEAKRISGDIISRDDYDIATFVEDLGVALTSTVVEKRVNGTRLLSAVLAQLPKDFLNASQLEFLSTFYADRMKDQHNVMPAVIDALAALTAMQQLPSQSIPQLLRSLFQNTECQSQTRGDRAKLFRLFKHLSEKFLEELKAMSGDFLYGFISSIDGERDPRNLDFIFSFMPDFIAHLPLLHLAEEMFEIFACYFPIDFNPSKTDPDTITRTDLAAKLIACLVASPEFVDWTVTLALEKLESDLVVAKLDSLQLLHQASLKFPPTTLEKHFQDIWTALKVEILPGSDNAEILAAGLTLLRSLLERAAASSSEISHNYQTTILGTILPHLSDLNHRLFKPATAIGLVCVAGDAAYASGKILSTFLLKLCPPPGDSVAVSTQQSPPLDDDQRVQVYTIVAQLYKIASLRGAITQINASVSADLQSHVIGTLRRKDEGLAANRELQSTALSVLNECVPAIGEANRALIYQALLQFITEETVFLEFTQLLEQLGALHPIELQAHCIDACVNAFPTASIFVKRKIYKNLLALVPQIAFTQRVLHLIMRNVFDAAVDSDVRLVALQALAALLTREEERFVLELQNKNNLIDKLAKLATMASLEDPLLLDVLEQIATALSLIMQHLSVSEQYAIASEFLPALNLQKVSDLYVAKGLLGFLHKDISMDDHFERLLHDLSTLSLRHANPKLRQVAHHMLCSLTNKIDYSTENRSAMMRLIAKLRADIADEDAAAVEVLAWVGKGLIVRGAEEAGDIIEALAALLDHPSMASAAALAFDIISAEYPQLHLPIVKFLYRQKFFHTIVAKLGAKLEAFCEHHLDAFLCVLKATPHGVLKMNVEKIGPPLFQALAVTNEHTVRTALSICNHFVAQQDDYFRSHLTHIIPSCLQLAHYQASMQIRMDALNLLHDIAHYPTFVLLPHKTDVVLALIVPLDDPKRLVRNAAVRARNRWYLIGAPSAED